MEYTYRSTNFKNYQKKKVLGYFTKSAHDCFTLMFRNEHRSNFLPCLARDRKSLQRRIIANIFGKEVDLHWQEVCSKNSVFIIRSQ